MDEHRKWEAVVSKDIRDKVLKNYRQKSKSSRTLQCLAKPKLPALTERDYVSSRELLYFVNSYKQHMTNNYVTTKSGIAYRARSLRIKLRCTHK